MRDFFLHYSTIVIFLTTQPTKEVIVLFLRYRNVNAFSYYVDIQIEKYEKVFFISFGEVVSENINLVQMYPLLKNSSGYL